MPGKEGNCEFVSGGQGRTSHKVTGECGWRPEGGGPRGDMRGSQALPLWTSKWISPALLVLIDLVVLSRSPH